ncbi:unnamed protein product [Candidula unifasciata]|uniref:Exonuclease domain-containing protein n=1 Tax=Candidula unifasciata TaxID=100452 RepID=A0A8S4A1B2_9EUPU|nr:unnamed protein product [Candidula unifasciata]
MTLLSRGFSNHDLEPEVLENMMRLLPWRRATAGSFISRLFLQPGLLDKIVVSTASSIQYSTAGRGNQKARFQMPPPTVRSDEHGRRTLGSLSQRNPDRLVWVDLEMTGLDIVNDTILEIACLITEKDLQIVAEGPDIVIHQSNEVLDNMGEWCTEQHGKSGLTEAVRSSKVSLQEAEQMVLDFVKEYTPKGKCPLAGNSVGVDRSFIERHMPRLAEHLHYRVVDVSSVKELCRRWYPEDLSQAPVKKETHRAMDDIRESICELQFYRSTIFK